MKIYSMKATFGKLEHQVLTLKPGLNIIEAPNEWGKSTWCAFLISMLYGIDTRAKSTRNQLADKERFAPWSGAPMEGRMDLNWNGRNITIERSTKGRIPMGEFRAYETDTGLEVPELTADNCGQLLLGVEKDVFTRSGFLRFTDLPVTEDDQLRSRLNALVTTGDESGNAELLEQKLKELKNRCRYHKTGLIPQARLQKEKVEQQLQECETLDQQTQQLQSRIQDLEHRIRRLENHQAALRYAAVREHAATVQEARTAQEESRRQLEALRAQTETAPSREEAAQNIKQLIRLKEELASIQMQEQMLSDADHIPKPPQGFEGCTAREAVIQAQRHQDELKALRPKRSLLTTGIMIIGAFLILFGVCLLIMEQLLLCVICSGLGIATLIFGLVGFLQSKKRLPLYKRRLTELNFLYGCNDPEQWMDAAQQYAQKWDAYVSDGADTDLKSELYQRKELLVSKSMAATQGQGLESALEHWRNIVAMWDEYADVRCRYRQIGKQLQSLEALTADAPPPSQPDDLTFTEEETRRLISDASFELRQLHSKMGQYRGYADSLGSRDGLEAENNALEQRLHELEKTYAALEVALKALEQATAQLQRRFAPRISHNAQQILSQLTNGRYNRLTMAQDFSIHAGAVNEDILRSRHWRSDGTVDQLYLALRLAVARELLPKAPLVLDDAMVRFDNDRLQSAMEILKGESKTRQVIIFTCHGRERELLGQDQ